MFAVGELSCRISVRFFKCYTSDVIMLATPIFSIQSLSTNLIVCFLLGFFGGVGHLYTFRSDLLEYLWHVPLTESYRTDIISTF